MKRWIFSFTLLLSLALGVVGQTPGTSQFPTSLDTNTTLLTAVNNCSTTLNGAVTNSQTTFTVVSTACFPSSGIFATESELVIYTGKTSTDFTGLTRGAFGTSAVAHSNGIATRLSILAQYHNALKAAIIATQTKLGAGAATPSNNTVFRGTGTGTTDFGQIAVSHIQSGALSGNGSKVGTITGTTTSGKCLEWDANGNIVTAVSNAACGSGGGSSTWNSLTDPGGNLALAMATRLTAFTWDGNYGSTPAFDLQANDTTATGALLRLRTAVSTLMPPLLIEARTGQSFKADHLQNLFFGRGGLGGGDTDGYPNLPAVASNSFPTSTPTTASGWVPMVAESNGINSEYTIWIYGGSAWRDVGGQHKRYDTGSGSSAQTINFNSSTSANTTRVFTLTGATTTFTFSNPPPNGSLITIIVVQDGTGSRTVTWPSSVKWSGGTAPTLTATASKRDVFHFVWDGSNYWSVSQSLNQ